MSDDPEAPPSPEPLFVPPDPAVTEWVPIWNPMGSGPVGPTGPTGPQGATGNTGATGATGSQGPQGIQGVQGPQGVPGTAGELWFSGTGAPAGGLAGTAVGDWYLDMATGDVYEKTGASTWTVRGNIKGPQGIQGPIGPQGIQGPIGPSGATSAHHATHEPGGADALVNAAWTNRENVFTEHQHIQGPTGGPPWLLLEHPAFATADLKNVLLHVNSGTFYLGTFNDAGNNWSGGGYCSRDSATGAWSFNAPLSSTGRHTIVQDAGLLPSFYGLEVKHATHTGIILNETGAAFDAKKFRMHSYQTRFYIDALNDAETGIISRPLTLDRAGNAAVGGQLNTSGAIVAGTDVYSTAAMIATTFMYPGQVGAGQQTSWYLGSHGSYGLYSNTGFYNEGGVFTSHVEARNHIRAAGGLYDYARGTPIGVWIDFTPQPGNFTVNAAYMARWMVVGKTLFINLYWNITIGDGVGWFYIPNGFVSASYLVSPMSSNVTVFPLWLNAGPGGGVINMYGTNQGNNMTAGTYNVNASLFFSIQ